MSCASPELCNSAPLPSLHCRHCDAFTLPIVGPGTGPHVASARCGESGGFLKWIPKVLVAGNDKERNVVASMNRVALLGEVGKYGVTVRYANNGTPCANFMLVTYEEGQDGNTYPTLIPCEVWGKKAEAAAELESGQLCLFEGKLRRRKKDGDTWDLVVSGLELTPVQPSTVMGVGTSMPERRERVTV